MHPPRNSDLSPKWAVSHAVTPSDATIITAIRAASEPTKGKLVGTAARQPFDEIMGHVKPPTGVEYEQDTVGDVAGLWARPADVRSSGAILYLHGGWYAWGSVKAYRHLVGHIAAHAGAPVFAADYRLAPEHPFPAAIIDAEAAYQGLVERGVKRIALAGDSAGGGLTLALTSLLVGKAVSVMPAGCVALSPLTDLTLSGSSWETRAAADPYFTRSQGLSLTPLYVGSNDPKNPLISPLFGHLAGLPPIRVHVGDDEVLLDDSLRYVEHAAAAGVDARVDIWQGMPHVFLSAAGQLSAADEALEAVGAFLSERLSP